MSLETTLNALASEVTNVLQASFDSSPSVSESTRKSVRWQYGGQVVNQRMLVGRHRRNHILSFTLALTFDASEHTSDDLIGFYTDFIHMLETHEFVLDDAPPVVEYNADANRLQLTFGVQYHG